MGLQPEWVSSSFYGRSLEDRKTKRPDFFYKKKAAFTGDLRIVSFYSTYSSSAWPQYSVWHGAQHGDGLYRSAYR